MTVKATKSFSVRKLSKSYQVVLLAWSETDQHSGNLQHELLDTVTWVERLPPGGSDGAEGVLDTIQGDALQFLELLSIPEQTILRGNQGVFCFIFCQVSLLGNLDLQRENNKGVNGNHILREVWTAFFLSLQAGESFAPSMSS